MVLCDRCDESTGGERRFEVGIARFDEHLAVSEVDDRDALDAGEFAGLVDPIGFGFEVDMDVIDAEPVEQCRGSTAVLAPHCAVHGEAGVVVHRGDEPERGRCYSSQPVVRRVLEPGVDQPTPIARDVSGSPPRRCRAGRVFRPR